MFDQEVLEVLQWDLLLWSLNKPEETHKHKISVTAARLDTQKTSDELNIV